MGLFVVVFLPPLRDAPPVNSACFERMVPPTNTRVPSSSQHVCCCQAARSFTGVDYWRVLGLYEGTYVPCHCRHAGFNRAVDLLAKNLRSGKDIEILGNR